MGRSDDDQIPFVDGSMSRRTVIGIMSRRTDILFEMYKFVNFHEKYLYIFPCNKKKRKTSELN